MTIKAFNTFPQRRAKAPSRAMPQTMLSPRISINSFLRDESLPQIEFNTTKFQLIILPVYISSKISNGGSIEPGCLGTLTRVCIIAMINWSMRSYKRLDRDRSMHRWIHMHMELASVDADPECSCVKHSVQLAGRGRGTVSRKVMGFNWFWSKVAPLALAHAVDRGQDVLGKIHTPWRYKGLITWPPPFSNVKKWILRWIRKWYQRKILKGH